MPVLTEPPQSRVNGTAAPRRGVLGTAIQATVLLLLLAMLAAVVLGLFALMSLMNAPNQLAGGVGDRITSVSSQAAHAAQQALQNATDPNHPPSGLTYDTEFSALQTWRVGDELPGGSEYVLTLRGVTRREGADSPDTALYAVVHAELRRPHETRVLGQLIRSDADPHDFAVYKGESFRIGRALYRVNWISQEQQAMAAGTYRNPDAVNASLKFAYE